MNSINIFSSAQNQLGESPRWHPVENCLYWVDIDACLIHRQAACDHKMESFNIGCKVGCLGFAKSCGLILATSIGIQYWDPGNNHLTPIVDPEPDKAGSRFNDGLIDANGRFWAGTMTEIGNSSCLYRLNPDHSIATILSGISISNGIGWNKENTRFYFTDTMKRTVWCFDFDLSNGSIANRRVFFEVKESGLPDGLAVDSDGNVWCVISGAGKIQVRNPAGTQIDELIFPTRCITSCTFGGTDLSVLYVTSSRVLLNPIELGGDPLAGNVFFVKTHSFGLASHFFG